MCLPCKTPLPSASVFSNLGSLRGCHSKWFGNFRKKSPAAWHKFWGLVHPNFLDCDFYQSYFSHNPFFLTSNPYQMQEIENWGINPHERYIADHLSGDELLIIAKK